MAQVQDIKLTPKQNAVIWCLQNGWELITSSEMKGAIVACKEYEYKINNGLFFRLVQIGLIYQQFGWPFYYVLTPLGEKIKTKPVEVTLNQPNTIK